MLYYCFVHRDRRALLMCCLHSYKVYQHYLLAQILSKFVDNPAKADFLLAHPK